MQNSHFLAAQLRCCILSMCFCCSKFCAKWFWFRKRRLDVNCGVSLTQASSRRHTLQVEGRFACAIIPRGYRTDPPVSVSYPPQHPPVHTQVSLQVRASRSSTIDKRTSPPYPAISLSTILILKKP